MGMPLGGTVARQVIDVAIPSSIAAANDSSAGCGEPSSLRKRIVRASWFSGRVSARGNRTMPARFDPLTAPEASFPGFLFKIARQRGEGCHRDCVD